MNVFLYEIKTVRKSTLSWTLSLSVIVFIILAMFPSFHMNSMQEMMKGIDPTLLAAFGLTDMIDLNIITNFFGYTLQYITLALMIYVMQQAASLLIKEESEGTIEYLYAKPVSRSDIFLQKLLAHFVLFVIMLLALGAVSVAGYLIFSDMAFSDAVRENAMFYGAILFAAAVFMAVGVLASSLVKSAKTASAIALSAVFGTFVAGIIAVLIDKLSFLKYISPLDWIKTQKLLEDGIRMQEWVIGLTIIAACTLCGFFVYRRKDLLV